MHASYLHHILDHHQLLLLVIFKLELLIVFQLPLLIVLLILI